jgi:glyoxylase-like metal-dependent hydrolase (beta-lactamase superfamily II)
MQEISSNIFIENAYPGVTLAAIRCRRGLLLIDAPLRIEDARNWRSTLAGMYSGFDRLLVTLDEHYDRTLGTRQMECMTAGQEALHQALRDRPVSFKTQGQDTGAEWELVNGLGVVRWAIPDITFTKSLDLYWGDFPVHLQAVPGPSRAAIWVELPKQKMIFVGDTVIAGAPPFLAAANLPAWQDAVARLLTPEFKEYTIISGRGGVVSAGEVKEQGKFLAKVQQVVDKFADRESNAREIDHACLQFLKSFEHKTSRFDQYYSRLSFGLSQYIRQRTLAGN